MASKEAERKCLKDAIEYLKKQKGIAKTIGLSLEGTDVKRADTERPDFLLHSTGDNGTLTAVEHFEVDMLSTVREDKVLSFSNKFQKDTKHIFDKWSDKVISSDKVPDGAVDDAETAREGITDAFFKGVHPKALLAQRIAEHDDRRRAVGSRIRNGEDAHADRIGIYRHSDEDDDTDEDYDVHLDARIDHEGGLTA